jgi:hypothetical protein
MGNMITSERVPGSEPVYMSNGLTSVFFDVLALAGSALAETEWEQRLAYWLVSHDQSLVGIGCVGFDVADMGWTAERLDAQKAFVFELVDAAQARRGWEHLRYSPRPEAIGEALEGFRRLVADFPAQAVGRPVHDQWTPGELPRFGTCERHGVFLHEYFHCIICNYEPLG